MQLLRPKGWIWGFWAVEVHRIIPEVLDCGETWEPPAFRLGPHIHRHWELHYLAKGTVEWMFGQERRVLTAGSVYCLAPNVPHWVRRSSGSEHHIHFVGFNLRTVEARHPDWAKLSAGGPVFWFDEAWHLERWFRDVSQEALSPAAFQGLGLRLALDRLVLEVIRCRKSRVAGPSAGVMHPALARAVGLIEARFREEWSLKSLAEQAGISPRRLTQLFQAEVRTSVHRYLNAVRVRHAEALLRGSELGVSAIAGECGFATRQHFGRIFKEVNGRSPQAYGAVSRGLGDPAPP